MRTTVSFDEALLKRAKAHAQQTDRTLSEFVQDAVREALTRVHSQTRLERIELPVVKGRLRSGISYDSFAELHELTEQP